MLIMTIRRFAFSLIASLTIGLAMMPVAGCSGESAREGVASFSPAEGQHFFSRIVVLQDRTASAEVTRTAFLTMKDLDPALAWLGDAGGGEFGVGVISDDSNRSLARVRVPWRPETPVKQETSNPFTALYQAPPDDASHGPVSCDQHRWAGVLRRVPPQDPARLRDAGKISLSQGWLAGRLPDGRADAALGRRGGVGEDRVFGLGALAVDPVFVRPAGGVVPNVDTVYRDFAPVRRADARRDRRTRSHSAQHGLADLRGLGLRIVHLDIDTTVKPLFGEQEGAARCLGLAGSWRPQSPRNDSGFVCRCLLTARAAWYSITSWL